HQVAARPLARGIANGELRERARSPRCHDEQPRRHGARIRCRRHRRRAANQQSLKSPVTGNKAPIYEAALAQIRKTIPSAVRPNATAARGSNMSIAASVLRSLLPQTAKSPIFHSRNGIFGTL